MKSSCSEDFKADLTFDIWPSRSWKNWGQRHQGSFSFFTWICKVLSIFSSCNHSSGLSKHQFDILLYFLWYFPHKWPSFYQKNATDIDFFEFFVEITQKNDFKLPENVKTENDPWCLWPQFFQLQLGQMSKVRSVLKSSERADFKTDLPFWIW